MTEDKLEFIIRNIVAINKTLEFQAQQLEEHIRRTELLESRFSPIEDHVKFIQTSLKGLLYLSSLAGLITLILGLLK